MFNLEFKNIEVQMKKIGILCGAENSFPFSLIEYINSRVKNAEVELVKVGFCKVGEALDYDIIFDRVSREVPMYQSILKSAALAGVKVINDPFLRCLEDYFFQYNLANKLGVKTPKTVIIPTKEHPEGTTSETFKNLIYPLNWSDLFDYIGFPLIIRLNVINNEALTFRVYNPMEFFSAYDYSGNKQLIVQEDLKPEAHFRVFVVGKEKVRIFNYDPNKPLVARYSKENNFVKPELKSTLETLAKMICVAANLDFTTIDFVLSNDEVYVYNFYNTTPRIDTTIFSDDEYEWFVFTLGDYLISLLERPKNTSELSNKGYNLFVSDKFR
ncbi:hypothetical protein D9V87_07815 [Bacteroidetes/Chlorobi group bacterium MS-B_bin-24]|nr:MAG: hypothetical protein D9V87_07815 [Bacteroidetes/Chlorobi group bacterium MS-B_bin-24]